MSGRISARQDASNVIVSKGPDVLRTRRGNVVLPVAYHTISFLDQATRVSTSVRNNGKYDFQLNSRGKYVEGHDAGKEKGVSEQGYKKWAHVDVASDFVYSEGFATVSHRDPAWITRPDDGDKEAQKPMQMATVLTSSLAAVVAAMSLSLPLAAMALSAAMKAAGLGASAQPQFDINSGDISHGGEKIGNLKG